MALEPIQKWEGRQVTSLKWKLRIYYGALLLGLLGLAAISTASIVLRDFRLEMNKREVEVQRAARRVLLERFQDINVGLDRALQDGRFLEMVRRDLDLPRDVTQAEWVPLAQDLSREYQLPLFKILDSEGTILSSAHWQQSFNLRDSPGLIMALESGQGVRLVKEQNGQEEFLSLMASRWTRQPRRYVMIAGIRADGEFVSNLVDRLGVPVNFELVEFDSSQASPLPPSDESTRIELNASPSEALGFARLEFDRSSVRDLKARLAQIFGITTLVGIALAWILGVWISSRVTRPLEDLAEAVAVLATGQTPHPIAAQGSYEIRELVHSFNSMSRSLAQSRERLRSAERIAAWRDVARRIAHEIKNAMVPIQLSVESVARSVHTGRGNVASLADESVTTVRGEIEGLTRLVNSFNEFARLPDPELRENDLRQTWQRAVAAFQGSLDIVENGWEDLPSFEYDEDQIRRCLHNIVKNAQEAGAGRISLAVHPGSSEWHVRIADDGPGIARGDMTHIFDPYFTRKEEGTGLGLAIVYKIITDHGWNIAAESPAAPGQEPPGTAFTISIPIRKIKATEKQHVG